MTCGEAIAVRPVEHDVSKQEKAICGPVITTRGPAAQAVNSRDLRRLNLALIGEALWTERAEVEVGLALVN
jgi:hypothetical protein